MTIDPESSHESSKTLNRTAHQKLVSASSSMSLSNSFYTATSLNSLNQINPVNSNAGVQSTQESLSQEDVQLIMNDASPSGGQKPNRIEQSAQRHTSMNYVWPFTDYSKNLSVISMASVKLEGRIPVGQQQKLSTTDIDAVFYQNEASNDSQASKSFSVASEESVYNPRYSFMISDDTADGPVMDLVSLYRATVIYDYVPLTLPDIESDALSTSISLKKGESVVVFGVNSVGYADIKTGDFWRRDKKDILLDIKKDVDVSGGWCQVQKSDESSGFAPVSYLEFQPLPSNPRDELPTTTNFRTERPISQYGIDSKAHHRISSGQYMTSFPAPPNVSHTTLDFPIHTNDFVGALPSSFSKSIHEALFSTAAIKEDEIRRFILEGAAEKDSSRRNHVQSTVSLANSTSATIGHGHYVIDIDSSGSKWRSNVPSYRVLVHTPQRCFKDIHSMFIIPKLYTPKDEYVSYKISTWFPAQNGNKRDINVTVERRYNDFAFLNSYIHSCFPASTLATLSDYLPPKEALTYKFNLEHVEKRRRKLQLYLDQIVRHPLLRSHEVIMAFLSSGGTESEWGILNETSWPFDATTKTASIDDSEWRKGFEQVSDQPTRSFFSSVVLPSNATYTNLSSSTSKLMRIESVVSQLDAVFTPFNKAARNLESHTRQMEDIYKDIGEALYQSGRLLSQTKHTNDGCWDPSCRSCAPMGEAMVGASLQFKRIADSHRIHGAKHVPVLQDMLNQIKSTIPRLKALSKVASTSANVVATCCYGRDANRIQPSLADPMNHALADQFHIIQKRAATVIAVADAEARCAHEEKIAMLEDTMSAWLENEIVTNEKVLKRLKAAKELFHGQDARK